MKLTNVRRRWKGGAWGAVWGSKLISTQAAYTVGEASNEAEGWALLGPVVESDGEVGFGGVLSSHWGGFRQRLQWLKKASPASAKLQQAFLDATGMSPQYSFAEQRAALFGQVQIQDVRACLVRALTSTTVSRAEWKLIATWMNFPHTPSEVSVPSQ